jgi:Uma2 family endonuclease
MLGLVEKISHIEQLITPLAGQNLESESLMLVNGISWEMYEELLAQLGDSSGLRISYLEGTLEIMSPSRRHESEKKIIAMLLETYFFARGIRFYPLGSTTFRSEAKARGREPDECYCLHGNKSIPDIILEVVITSGGINSLAIYQGLGVPEVWFWERGQFSLYCLREGGYQQVSKSELLPELDLNLLASYVSWDEPFDAVLAYRKQLSVQN